MYSSEVQAAEPLLFFKCMEQCLTVY